MIDITPTELLCKRFEGFSSKVYLDPIGVPTIGYGSTYYSDGSRVKIGDKNITQEEALDLLRSELLYNYLPSVMRLTPILYAKAIMEDDIYKLCAILDFCYNCGAGNLQVSTLRRKINERKWNEVPEQLMKWNKAGGKVFKGLTLRCQARVDIFNTKKEPT